MSRETATAPPRGALEATGLVVMGVGSVQFGAALAKTLFDEAGPGGTVLLRVLLAAVLLAALWRPRLRGHSASDLWLAAAFGLTLAGMNFTFYEALDRIPLGIAVAFEFVGPLGVAIAGSRKALDLLWVGLAAGGILLLSELGGADLDPLGVLLAVVAGGFWAAYILIAARAGQLFPGGAGLALAMIVASALLLPIGIADGGADLLRPEVLGIGAAVAVLSSAIPYSLELEALRSLPPRVFGVLMSLEPAVAALAGFVVLDQLLALHEVLGILLVAAASAGAALGARVALRDA
jgi:inner membrane transporter RhtA